jgi:hypothetical protein
VHIEKAFNTGFKDPTIMFGDEMSFLVVIVYVCADDFLPACTLFTIVKIYTVFFIMSMSLIQISNLDL